MGILNIPLVACYVHVVGIVGRGTAYSLYNHVFPRGPDPHLNKNDINSTSPGCFYPLTSSCVPGISMSQYAGNIVLGRYTLIRTLDIFKISRIKAAVSKKDEQLSVIQAHCTRLLASDSSHEQRTINKSR
jgi:hypothetical protein